MKWNFSIPNSVGSMFCFYMTWMMTIMNIGLFISLPIVLDMSHTQGGSDMSHTQGGSSDTLSHVQVMTSHFIVHLDL